MPTKYGSLGLTLVTLKCKIFGTADERRWRNLENIELGWGERTRIIAGVIPAGSRVIEFGAGHRQLEACLDPGSRYYPCDLVARGEGTIIFDLNKRPLPDLRHLELDVAVFAGVLEYVRDLPSLIQWLSTIAPTCIASYECCATRPQTFLRVREAFKRIRTGWVNAYSEAELEGLFAAAGFSCDRKLTWETPQGSERIFLFKQ